MNFASNVQYLTEHVTGNSLQARVVNILVTPESFCSPLSRREKQWFRKKSHNEIQSKISVLLCVHIGTFFAAILAKTTKKIHQICENSFSNARKPPTETVGLLLDEVLHVKSKSMV